MVTKVKRPTKNARLLAIFDLFMDLHNRRGVGATMEEVSIFALAKGLYPVPAFRDPAEVHDEWEKRLQEVKDGQ